MSTDSGGKRRITWRCFHEIRRGEKERRTRGIIERRRRAVRALGGEGEMGETCGFSSGNSGSEEEDDPNMRVPPDRGREGGCGITVREN
jgi:hypothetical protein